MGQVWGRPATVGLEFLFGYCPLYLGAIQLFLLFRILLYGPASVVRLQAAELVKWRFRNGQVPASLDQLMSWAEVAQKVTRTKAELR